MPHPSSSSSTKEHHYAIDAAILLDQCRQHLRFIIDQQKDRVNVNVLDLDRTLLTMEQLLHYHLLTLLEYEQGGSRREGHSNGGEQKEEDEFIGRQGDSFSCSFDRAGSRDELDSTKSKFIHVHGDTSGATTTSTSTLDPLMKTVEDLKKVMNKKQKRKRSISFLNWHHYNETQLQHQQQEQQHDNRRVTQRSFTSKHYSRALKAAQKNLSTNDHNYNSINEFDPSPMVNPNTNINANIINGHFACSISPPPSQPSNPLPLPAATPTSAVNTAVKTNSSLKEKSALDSILFRLIVALQLCLVRIEEAHYLLCCGYYHNRETSKGHDKNDHDENKNNDNDRCIKAETLDAQDIGNHLKKMQRRKGHTRWMKVGTTMVITCTSTYLLTRDKVKWNMDTLANKESLSSILKTGTKALTLTSSFFLVRRGWRMITMNARLVNTIFAIEDLQHQWMLLHSIQMNNNVYEHVGSGVDDKSSDKQCKNLLHLIPYQKSSVSFLLSVLFCLG